MRDYSVTMVELNPGRPLGAAEDYRVILLQFNCFEVLGRPFMMVLISRIKKLAHKRHCKETRGERTRVAGLKREMYA